MTLPIQPLRGIHEIEPLGICVDFGHICGRDPRKGAPILILGLSQRMGVLVARFASCSGLRRLSYWAAQDQRCHADLVSTLDNLCVDLKLGLQLAVFRLGYHFVTNLALAIAGLRQATSLQHNWLLL